ncbi:hypothetical protein QUF80_20125 [Desulfococcaceae bacterium HSG8]|nr:hypothetical protein [Desulfococcaceae bacterium HSG8]
MIIIKGIGWIKQQEYGCAIKKIRRNYDNMRALYSQLNEEKIFSYPIKSFGKSDAVSKNTCCTTALALHDASISYAEDRKQDMGILGTNTAGCVQSNADYFKDYVESGRTLARGNLFVYTLPSTPLADAAIHFKCQGPVLYMAFKGEQIPSLLRHAEKMILRDEAPAMLAVRSDEKEGVCFVLAREEVLTENVMKPEDVIAGAECGNFI